MTSLVILAALSLHGLSLPWDHVPHLGRLKWEDIKSHPRRMMVAPRVRSIVTVRTYPFLSAMYPTLASIIVYQSPGCALRSILGQPDMLATRND